jgi:hypothetical protein
VWAGIGSGNQRPWSGWKQVCRLAGVFGVGRPALGLRQISGAMAGWVISGHLDKAGGSAAYHDLLLKFLNHLRPPARHM